MSVYLVNKKPAFRFSIAAQHVCAHQSTLDFFISVLYFFTARAMITEVCSDGKVVGIISLSKKWQVHKQWCQQKLLDITMKCHSVCSAFFGCWASSLITTMAKHMLIHVYAIWALSLYKGCLSRYRDFHFEDKMVARFYLSLTHLPLVPHICVSESD